MNYQNFKKYRNDRGLSQSELAKLLDVHRTYICRIENGKVKPSLGLMEQAAKVLNRSLKDFF